jgi:hypothetical protein
MLHSPREKFEGLKEGGYWYIKVLPGFSFIHLETVPSLITSPAGFESPGGQICFFYFASTPGTEQLLDRYLEE